MTRPDTFRVTSYQERAYLAEHATIAKLAATDQLLGWPSHDDMVAFHETFAPAVFNGRPIPELSKGTGAGSSRYYAYDHRLKIRAADRHIVGYCHELAHAMMLNHRGNGHHPRWAGAFVRLVRSVDPRTGDLLASEMKALRLTITQ